MVLTFLLLLSSLLSLSSATATDNDLAALLSLKASLSDPLNSLTSWVVEPKNQTSNHCQWRGVSCDHQQRVTVLSLDTLSLAGALPPSLSNLTYITTLSLANNKLSGTLPPSIGQLSRLQNLTLSNNSFSGEIPGNLSGCRHLTTLSLDTNEFTGEIPSSLGELAALTRIQLYTNNLTGRIPNSLGNLSALASLDLSDNCLSGGVPESLSGLKNLGFLQLSVNCLSGRLTEAIFNSSSLFHIDLGSNGFNGSLPIDIGSHLPAVKKLYLYSNQLSGSIPAALGNASMLERLGIEVNQFSGIVPSEIGTIRTLSWLALGNNRLEGEDAGGWGFIDALANYSTDLEILEISDNLFDGVLPLSLGNLSTQLTWLSMEDNQISGVIPAEIGRYVNLTFLSVSNNLLNGSIPSSIGRLESLNILRLFGNRLSGELPSSLGNLSQLNELNLGGNDIVGSIPASFGGLQNLNLLNLSCNRLTGPIPKEVVSLSSLTRYLDLSHNSLDGALPWAVGSLRNIMGLNVSNNMISGEIPGSLRECQVLVYLNMEGNMFQGGIPPALFTLKGIEELDLSRNNLSGKIPTFLGNFLSLQLLNLSFNDLEGQVPRTGIFGNASQVSLVGNRDLCGGDPELHLQACPNGTSKHRNSSLKVIISVTVVVSFLAVFSSLLGVAFWIKISRKPSAVGTKSTEDQYSGISYKELFNATHGFSSANLIGVGGFGHVYKGFIDCDVAVKVINLQQQGASRSFISECEALKSTRHRNLVKILTICVSVDSEGNDFKALVFEYMPNGSLDEWLHPEEGRSRRLSFLQRLNIAIDVGFALDHLHHYAHTPIVHCDLKPSNVLLDADMVAHVSDFGLAKFIATTNSASSIMLRGSIGFVPPEYGMGSEVSTYGDVYSYGILLLEMLTGIRPTDDALADGLSLHNYAEANFPKNVMDIIDSYLVSEVEEGKVRDGGGKASVQECLVSMVGIAISCCKASPKERGEMGSIVKKLVEARDILLGSVTFEIDKMKK